MEMRTVPNPRRGCGQLKEGGYYARGDVSPNGSLASWSWCLGQMTIGGRNLPLAAPARQLQVIRLPDSLAEGKVMADPSELAMAEPLLRLPDFALLDHVGAADYSAHQFEKEIMRHGPSRRIAPAMAEAIASYTPIPILFSHSHMPVVDPDYQAALQAWADADDEFTYEYGKSCDNDLWGIRAIDYRGDYHWSIPVLAKLAEHHGQHLTKVMLPELAENVLMEEQTFGMSWITRVVYITSSRDSDKKIEDLLGKGIEPVVAED